MHVSAIRRFQKPNNTVDEKIISTISDIDPLLKIQLFIS